MAASGVKFDAAAGGGILFPADSLNATVARLGLISGLLFRADGGKQFELNTAWFQNPVAEPGIDPSRRSIRTIPTNPQQRQELLALFEELLGSVSADALGIPTDSAGRKWYPVKNPLAKPEDADANTGLYLVTEERPVGDAGDTETVVGLGALHTFDFLGVLVEPYAYFPFLRMPPPAGGSTFVLGDAAYPIELGIQVTDPKGPFGTDDVSFDGVKVAATIEFTENPLQLNLVLLNLKLPNQPAADMSVNDLLKTPANEWVATGAYLLVSQLVKAAPPERAETLRNVANALLAVLGLTGEIPSIDWNAIVHDPSSAGRQLAYWLKSLASNPAILGDWLNEWYCLVHGVKPNPKTPYVKGSGSRSDPWRIELVAIDGNQVELTVGTTVVKDTNTLLLYPGVLLASKTAHPVASLPDVGVRIEAAAELLEIALPPSGQPLPPPAIFPSFHAQAVLSNPTSAFKLGTEAPAEGPLISIESIQAGFDYRTAPNTTLGAAPGSFLKGIYPSFRLTGVQTRYGAWDAIDLLNFDELVQDAGELLVNLVQTKLDEFFNVTGESDAAKMARSCAAILGVQPPPGYTIETWPVKQLLLNGPGGVQAIVNDPLAAWAGYYQRCLTTEGPGQKPAWALLLPSLAGVLGDVGALGRAATGSGSADDPWRIQLFGSDPAVPAAYLESWKADSLTPAGSPIIRIGLSFRVPLPVKQISMGFALRTSLIDILLPDASGQGTSANWLPDASAEFRITGPPKDGKPTPLVTPALGGVSVSSDAVLIAASWTRTPVSKEQAALPNSAFFGVAGLTKVKLLNNGAVVEDIGDIQFSFTPTSWNIPDLGKFTQLFFDAAGLWILAYGGPFGVTLVSAFGLSPDLAQVFNNPPEGGYPFALPDLKLAPGWPRLDVKVDSSASFFTNPWRAMRAQLQAVLGAKETAVPMMRILGWAVIGTLPPAPDPQPQGNRESPWFTELTNFWNLSPLFWTEPANGQPARLGFGVSRTMLDERSADVALRVAVRVDICEVAVAGGAFVTSGGTLPRGTLIATLANPDPSLPVVSDEATGLQIGSARIGFGIDLNAVEPVVTLYKARFDSDSPLETIDLAAALGTTKQNQILESLMYALMKKISAELDKIPGIRAMLELLTELQFVLKPEDGVYGLNLGAWTAMIADPPRFLIGQMTQVLENPASLAAFQQSLATLLGYPSFELPATLQGLPDLLVALDLAQHPAGGYALRLSSWVALTRNPVGYLTTQGKRLLDPADDSLRLALVTALSKLPKPDPKIPLPDLPLTIENNTLITLRIPVDKLIKVGNALQIEAKLVANVQDLSLATEVSVVSKFAGLRLLFTSNLGIGAAMLLEIPPRAIATHWGLALSGAGEENVPAPFDPIVFYPLPDAASIQKYLETLGLQIPIILISSLATQLVNAFVVGDGVDPRYPLLYRILENFGLTVPNAAEGRPNQVQSLAGFLMHPWDWVISPRALGDGAGFDLNKVGKLLHNLPGSSGVDGPGNIKLISDGTNGMKITGLPFGTTSISFAADSTDGIQIGTSISYTFAVLSELQAKAAANLGITPKIDIAARMGFGTGAGVAVGGTVTPSFIFDVTDPQKPTTLSVTAGYAMKSGFILTLAGQFGGTAFPPDGGQIFLVPFGGLSQFQAGAVALLDFAANQLIKLYDNYKTAPGHNPVVVTTVDNLMGVAAFFGVSSVSTLLDTFKTVKTDPIAWLVSFFEEPKLSGTLAELVKLFGPGYLNLPGFSVSGTLLTYVPPSFPPALGTLRILLGQREGTFGVWVEPAIDREWVAIGAETGIGLTTPMQTNPKVVFTLSVNGGLAKQALPPQMTGAPTLALGLTAGTAAAVKYFLRFYPAGEGTSASTLLVELLPPPPHFAYGDNPSSSVPAAEWLPKFVVAYLVPLVADIVLQTEKVTGWLNAPLVSSVPASPAGGVLLKDWGLLVAAKPGPPVVYALHDLQTIFDNGSGQRMSAIEIVEKLFFVVLKGLDGIRIVPIGKDGGIYIASASGGVDGTDYGLRLLVPDISIWGKTADGAAKNGSTALQVQLGKWLTGHAACPKNWVVASDKALEGIVKEPGVLFYFVRMKDASNTLAFHPKIQLVSIGVDFTGVNGKPLVDVNGFKLGAFEPRIYFSLELDRAADLQLGAAIECAGMGVPLGPAQIKGNNGNKNPVAENLLTSGGEDKSGGEGDTGKSTGSVNPTFSLDLAYVYDPKNSTDLYARLFSQDGKDECTNFIWIAIQRAFGPIHCQQVGFGWEPDYHFDVGFDGSVTLAGLSMGLVNLRIGIPVKTPLDYSAYKLDLDGLDISYKGGPVSLTGGFLETRRIVDGQEITEYTGVASLIVGRFGLTALGSYALLGQNTPSLFVFALLSYPIGGPPYFFITGLAGGFGYNRNLLLPSQDTVALFPFVAGALDPAYFGGNDPGNALKKLGDVSQPVRGQYWLAAGIKFTSFQMINAFALLTVSFGADFELALIGLATIDLPITVKGGDSYTAIAHAGLQILVAFQPSVGQLAVTAALTLDSYVLDKACHLTGGFAFYVWFPPNNHAGEFVVTLGGYHPRFNKPDYYPSEPRVGFSWLMPNYGITIRGGCYFALTPTAVMAGGSLELLFQRGNLRAWLNAEANFLIQWKPFLYDIDIGVTVGASYRVDAWFIHTTFSIELGAALNIWGPPTGGKARVTWWVISFTIYFGPGKEGKQPLQWPAFDESFLPHTPKSGALTAGAGLQRDARIDAQVSKGLIRSEIVEATGEVRRWIVNPQSFEMLTSCVVPATEVKANTAEVTHALAPISNSNPAGTLRRPLSEVNTKLGIVPMNATGLQSTHTIALTKFDANLRAFQKAEDIFDVVAVTRSVPKAMWDPTPPGQSQQLAKDQVIADVMIGAQLTPKPIGYDSTLPVPAANLEFEAPGKSPFSWGNIKPPAEPQYPQYPPYRTIDDEMNTLMEAQVIARRRVLLDAARAASLFIDPAVDLSLLANTADQVFLAQPVLAPLGGLVEKH
jgi:hypothetical protein